MSKEIIKDLTYQLKLLNKERESLKRRSNIEQLNLTQTRYGIRIITDKIENVEKEIEKYEKS